MLISGLDEVGRGALAGPLIAVASLFNVQLSDWADLETSNSPITGVDDSKKLSPKKRRTVFQLILKHATLLDFGIGQVSAQEINRIGIDEANHEVFRRAVSDLHTAPDLILIDGDNPLFGWDMAKQRCRPRADGFWWPVGAASILAKVIRDSYMAELSNDWPCYGWDKNSGYGSEKHMNALRENGATQEHRTGFIKRIISRTSNDL